MSDVGPAQQKRTSIACASSRASARAMPPPRWPASRAAPCEMRVPTVRLAGDAALAARRDRERPDRRAVRARGRHRRRARAVLPGARPASDCSSICSAPGTARSHGTASAESALARSATSWPRTPPTPSARCSGRRCCPPSRCSRSRTRPRRSAHLLALRHGAEPPLRIETEIFDRDRASCAAILVFVPGHARVASLPLRASDSLPPVDRDRLRALLEAVREGRVAPEEALETLARAPYVETPDARIDLHRALRQGLPEVVYGAGKTPRQIADAVRALVAHGQPALVTRVAPRPRSRCWPSCRRRVRAPRRACSGSGRRRRSRRGRGTVLVVCAGTADLPVAREACEVARRFGNKVELLADVGVAGLHRLLDALPLLRSAQVADRGGGHGGRAAVGGGGPRRRTGDRGADQRRLRRRRSAASPRCSPC